MARTGLSTGDRYELDQAWHDCLTGSHDNQELDVLLTTLRRRVRRYDGAWARGLADIEGSCAQHARIADLLAEGKVHRAGTALKRHWRQGEAVVLAWLEAMEDES